MYNSCNYYLNIGIYSEYIVTGIEALFSSAKNLKLFLN